MAQKEIVEHMIAQSPNRRGFVRKLGIASAAVGAIAATGSAQAQSPSGVTDVDILNFALNLEYLEAEFYTVATTGKTIDQFQLTITGTGNGGATTGGSQVPWTPGDSTVQSIAAELAVDEQTHVSLLQNAITAAGGQAIAKPAINLNALGFGFGTQNDFLKLARIFEEIGVTAYGGAAPLIQDKTVLGYAARVLATEAEHVGTVRRLIEQYQIATSPLDGADIVPPPSGVKYFSTNGYAITAIRTPPQVLYLAYAAANAMSGGFFPSGVNGTLNMSAAAGATLDGNTLTASPNPIPAASAPGGYGTTMLTWQAPAYPATQVIQIRVNSPNGPLFTDMGDSGSIQTGPWVTDGMKFYLQDVTTGKALTAQNTLATVIMRVESAS